MPEATIYIADSRRMPEIEDKSIDLIVTSPPYWHIKDYGVKGQIGYGQTLHQYLKDLYRVWKESYRVLKPGRRLVINIGDQFARSTIYGRYKIIPIHAEIIAQCEDIGFDYMGAIIWQKKTTMNTTGGANVMGSYPYPPNGMVEIDYEFILIFKKPGKGPKAPAHIKEASRLSKEEWKEYFRGHWTFGPARQIGHEAMFPEELPRRIIRMFSFVGDTVLDPFLGSGTTVKVALEEGRNAIGYEINEEFVPLIRKKLGLDRNSLFDDRNVSFVYRKSPLDSREMEEIDYEPRIQDANPMADSNNSHAKSRETFRVREILDERTLLLNDGKRVRLLGIKVLDAQKAKDYLNRYVRGKKIYMEMDPSIPADNGVIHAYVYLKNRIFINARMIKEGLAVADRRTNYSMREKFMKLEKSHG